MNNEETRPRSRISEIEGRLDEHAVRLNNGVEVFQALKEDIDVLKPKPSSMYKIIAVTLTVVGLAGGALWTLANHLRDRPTMEEADRIVERHNAIGHSHMREDLREMQREQAKQRQVMTDGFGRLERLLEQRNTRRRGR